MKSWLSMNWSFGFAAIAIIAGYYSTPFGVKFVYWLYILGRQYCFYFLLSAWLILIVAFLIRMIGKLVHLHVHLSSVAIAIMLVSNLLATTLAPVDFIARMINFSGHFLSVRLGFTVYHLTISAPDSVRPFYSLYQCDDGFGMFCRTVADIPASVCKGSYPNKYSFYISTCDGTTLHADLNTKTIIVLENDRLIFNYMSTEETPPFFLLLGVWVIVAIVALVVRRVYGKLKSA